MIQTFFSEHFYHTYLRNLAGCECWWKPFQSKHAIWFLSRKRYDCDWTFQQSSPKCKHKTLKERKKKRWLIKIPKLFKNWIDGFKFMICSWRLWGPKQLLTVLCLCLRPAMQIFSGESLREKMGTSAVIDCLLRHLSEKEFLNLYRSGNTFPLYKLKSIWCAPSLTSVRLSHKCRFDIL